jgi:hypothetical protein
MRIILRIPEIHDHSKALQKFLEIKKIRQNANGDVTTMESTDDDGRGSVLFGDGIIISDSVEQYNGNDYVASHGQKDSDDDDDDNVGMTMDGDGDEYATYDDEDLEAIDEDGFDYDNAGDDSVIDDMHNKHQHVVSRIRGPKARDSLLLTEKRNVKAFINSNNVITENNNSDEEDDEVIDKIV